MKQKYTGLKCIHKQNVHQLGGPKPQAMKPALICSVQDMPPETYQNQMQKTFWEATFIWDFRLVLYFFKDSEQHTKKQVIKSKNQQKQQTTERDLQDFIYRKNRDIHYKIIILN